MDKVSGMSYIWGDSDPQIHGYLTNGLNQLPLVERNQVARRFIEVWCESCAEEDECNILFDFLCDKPIEEWKVQACFPFCEQYTEKTGGLDTHE
ncbi:MAG: hypothetical protein J7545_15570 [Roseofilum sp. SBFL]|uniref:hypothetical protein n=1 Tax=Roseofilum sp. SBFL TaxID=2821496 RepID=UPI001B03171F|nr:hypothetical protein [Roseofilum sp. SBFL]MBP0043366.1 hypothetical protein [Roseofilum sp. SBFL]